MRRAGAVLFAAAALAVTGCGGEDKPASTSGGEGLARAVPAAGTLLYGDVLVDPGEDKAKGVKEALRKVSRRDDVLDLLVKQIEKSAREEGTEFSYATDVKPWLGERAGIFLLNFENDPDGAALFEAEDEEAARKAIEKIAKGRQTRTYKDVEYRVDPGDDEAAGIVDGLAVIGTEAGVKAAIDATKGDSLAEAEQFESAVGKLDGDRLGTIWADAGGILKAIQGMLPAGYGGLEQILPKGGGKAPVAVGFDLDADGLTVDFLGEGLSQISGITNETKVETFEQLPAGAWLAFGVAKVGETVKAYVEKPALLGLTKEQLDQARAAAKQALGRDVVEVLEPVEELTIFASGTSLFGLAGGIIAKTGDPAALLSALRQGAEQAGLPVRDGEGDGFEMNIPDTPLQIAAGRDDERVAVGVGGKGPSELLDPDKTLADDEAYKSTKETLGDDFDPGMYIQVAPIVKLVESFGQDLGAEWAQAKPYVQAFKSLIVGSKQDGDTTLGRLVIALN